MDRRKVPESREKNDLSRCSACFVLVLGFLCSVFLGTTWQRNPHTGDRHTAETIQYS
jgi:hypothetical protein